MDANTHRLAPWATVCRHSVAGSIQTVSEALDLGVKTSGRMRETQLLQDIVNKSRLDKTEATIVNGEDLDVPTFIRRAWR